MKSAEFTRRGFLRAAAQGGMAAGMGGALLPGPAGLIALLASHPRDASALGALEAMASAAPRARFWVSTSPGEGDCLECHTPDEVEGLERHDHDDTIVRCRLCAQNCFIRPGERGRCRARMNVGGELRSLVYGRPVAVHVDPIEKKPFFHFLPGSQAYSLATAGCPLHCKFCQNWQLSQMNPEDYAGDVIAPGAIADAARSWQVPIVAFTYNEPTVFTEYLLDVARKGKPYGLRNVMISCGIMNEAPLAEIGDTLDAIKIDLKGFSEEFYSRVCNASLEPVLRSIRQVAKSGKHLEIVNLVVPSLNDSDRMLRDLSAWLVDEAGPDVPVHFTRFHPDYQLLNLSPTPVATLERARKIAMKAGLRYVYIGNVPGHPGNHTYCPGCGRVVIRRRGFLVEEIRMTDGKCAYCGHAIAGVWA